MLLPGHAPTGDAAPTPGRTHEHLGWRPAHLPWPTGKGRGIYLPLPQPQIRMIDSLLPPRWTKVIGVTTADIRVGRDGQVFLASAPGPIETPDLPHVALVVETGGARLSDESSPLVQPDMNTLCVLNAERLQVFPYLQLASPPLLHLPVLAFGLVHRSGLRLHK